MIATRTAGPDDVAALSLVGTQAFRDAYGSASSPADIDSHIERYFDEAAVSKELRKPDVRYIMATRGPACAGLVKVRNSDAPEAAPGNTAVEVQQLYVASDCQRMGVGRILMDCAVATARERGVDGIWLSVWTEAAWATSFYRGYGFQEYGNKIFDLGSAQHTDFVMWLATADR